MAVDAVARRGAGGDAQRDEGDSMPDPSRSCGPRHSHVPASTCHLPAHAHALSSACHWKDVPTPPGPSGWERTPGHVGERRQPVARMRPCVRCGVAHCNADIMYLRRVHVMAGWREDTLSGCSVPDHSSGGNELPEPSGCMVTLPCLQGR